MNESKPPESEVLLDAYLDGVMDADQREAFERDCEQSPALQLELERQHLIDAAIRRSFSPPSEAELYERIVGSMRGVTAPAHDGVIARLGRFQAVAVAASLAAMAVLGSWMIWQTLGDRNRPTDPYALQPHRTMQVVYQDKIDSGFQADWVCKDDAEFRQTFQRQLGQPLLLEPLPEGVAALGLSYCNTISPRTTCLLVSVEGRPVLIFADRLENETDLATPADDALNLYRREIGDLVLYELSPLDRPRVLEHFYNPDA